MLSVIITLKCFVFNQVEAVNSVGSTRSDWSLVRTLQAAPVGLAAPSIPSTSTYGMSVSWTPPQSPNGPIHEYRIYYKQASEPEQSVSVGGSDTSTFVSGLLAFTEYQVSVGAMNDAGSVRSSTTSATTREGYPSGLPKFNVEKINTGSAVILTWETPRQPNGEITDYLIYQAGSSVPVYRGLSQQFEFPRLLPFTEYVVSLEACTRSGCTRGEDQSFMTAETVPQDQPSPVMGNVNDTHITITWSPPVNPNGAITSYEVLRADTALSRRRRDTAHMFDLLGQNDMSLNIIRTINDYASSNSSGGIRFFHSKSNSTYNITADAHTKGKTIPKHNKTMPLSQMSLFLDNGFRDDIQFLQNKGTTADLVRRFSHERPGLKVHTEKETLSRFRRQVVTPPSDPVVVYQTADTDAESFSWTDSGLSPYTQYMYAVRASNSLGQVTSPWQVVRTEQAAPSDVRPPQLTHIADDINSLLVTWDEPEKMNGILQGYQVSCCTDP